MRESPQTTHRLTNASDFGPCRPFSHVPAHFQTTPHIHKPTKPPQPTAPNHPTTCTYITHVQPTFYLTKCAEAGAWLEFLAFAQAEGVDPRKLEDLSASFTDAAIREHIRAVSSRIILLSTSPPPSHLATPHPFCNLHVRLCHSRVALFTLHALSYSIAAETSLATAPPLFCRHPKSGAIARSLHQAPGGAVSRLLDRVVSSLGHFTR
jgi:hypothetical protein